MITLEIRKGYFVFRDRHQAFNLWIDNYRSDYPQLPPLDVVYEACQATGLSSEATIDKMLSIYHVRRLLKCRHLAAMPIVAGWLGSRGSGKSVGMAGAIIIDGLLAGRQVWSNMPVTVEVKYREAAKIFTTIELKKEDLLDIRNFERLQTNGIVCIDEQNLEIDEGLRQMSNVSLFFSYFLQEVRKLKLDVFFTTQDEMMTGSRTRFQTTIYIQCSDNAFKDGAWPKPETLGRKSHWKLYDNSGFVRGYIGRVASEMIFAELDFWNWPFWGAYDTGLLQGVKPVDLKRSLGGNRTKLEADQAILERLKSQYGLVSGMVWDVVNSNLIKMPKKRLWEMLHVENDHPTQTKVGKALSDLGCITKQGSSGRTFVFPGKDVLLATLKKLGLREGETSG